MNMMWSALDLARMHTADANFDVKDAEDPTSGVERNNQNFFVFKYIKEGKPCEKLKLVLMGLKNYKGVHGVPQNEVYMDKFPVWEQKSCFLTIMA